MSVEMKCGKPIELFNVFNAPTLISLENQNHLKFLIIFFSLFDVSVFNEISSREAGLTIIIPYFQQTMALLFFDDHIHVIQLCILLIQNLLYVRFWEKI